MTNPNKHGIIHDQWDSPHLFLREFFRDYKGWMQKHIREKKPPMWLLTVWMLGFEGFVTKVAMGKGAFSELSIIVFLGVTIVASFIGGFIRYWLGGLLYHARAFLANSTGTLRTSFNLNAYVRWPLNLVFVVEFLIDIALHGTKIGLAEPGMVDFIFAFMAFTAYIYSLRINYVSVRTIHGTGKLGTWCWFVILPAIFNGLLMIGFAAMSDSQL